MTTEAPLQVTVEIHLASGERRFRLSRRLQLPAALGFQAGLPVEGEEPGRVSLRLPDGAELRVQSPTRISMQTDVPVGWSSADAILVE